MSLLTREEKDALERALFVQAELLKQLRAQQLEEGWHGGTETDTKIVVMTHDAEVLMGLLERANKRRKF